jgi:hypothetical protein
MSSKTTEIVEAKLKTLRVLNIEEIMNNPLLAEIKIKNFIERFDNIFTFEEVLSEIHNSKIVASQFAKDPAKQNTTESWVADIVKSNPNIIEFESLPKGGKGSIRIGIDGNFIYDVKGQVVATKSVDYKFKLNGDTYYCTQKFTRGKGGAQDNQYKEVQEFLRYGSRVLAPRTYFVAILDGDYFDDSKMEELNTLFNQYRNVFATSADLFYVVVDKKK